MTDLVTRLRNWREVHLARLHLLMEEAADEMERLSSNGDCPKPDNAAKQDILTAKERKAVAFAAEHFGAFKNQAATLRGLLERLK
jgi:hypothetical protein